MSVLVSSVTRGDPVVHSKFSSIRQRDRIRSTISARCHDDCHALLRFAEIASSVPSSPVIFALHLHPDRSPSPSASFADCHADAACAEIVAALDQRGRLADCGTAAGSCAPQAHCPSAPRRRRLQAIRPCALCEEPVAPPQPSRPVRPPSRIINISRLGQRRGRTFSAGAAPMTAPISMRLAT